jgi:hypothetical protein
MRFKARVAGPGYLSSGFSNTNSEDESSQRGSTGVIKPWLPFGATDSNVKDPLSNLLFPTHTKKT